MIDPAYVEGRLKALREQRQTHALQLSQLDGAIAVLEQTLAEGAAPEPGGTEAESNGACMAADRGAQS